MSEKDELLELVYSFAGDLAGLEDDPREWAAWLVLLAEALEVEAMDDPAHPDAFEAGLAALRDALADRLSAGRW